MGKSTEMGTTDRYRADRADTLNLYENDDDEKEDEYVTPGGDDIQLELMNGYGSQENVQPHDDDEKEDEYVTAGGPDMDLHEIDDADDDDDVLLDGIGATLGNAEDDEKNEELND